MMIIEHDPQIPQYGMTEGLAKKDCTNNKKTLDKRLPKCYNKDTKREGHNPKSKGDNYYDAH